MTSAASNARWIAAAQAVKVLIQFLGVALLARLLTPHDYGLMAMVVVVTNFVGLLRDMGTAAAIIHDPQLNERTRTTVFWINVSLGLGLSVSVAVLARPIAESFRAIELHGPLIVLSPSFLITSLGSVSKALLERESKFALIARTEVSTAIIGLGVTLTLAIVGAGVMSWIWGILVSSFLSSGSLLLTAKWFPRTLKIDMLELSRLLRFSGSLSVFNIINYFSRNADALIIGRYLGASSLGIYSTAYKIMLFPLQNLTFVATRALYPILCRLDGKPDQQTVLYFKSLSVIVFFTAPLMTGVFVLREDFINVLMGPKWSAAIDVLVWLAPVGFLQSIISTTGTIFMVRARTDLLLRLGIFSAITQVGAFAVGVNFGVTAVAAAYLAANIINAFPSAYFALDSLGADVRHLWTCLWPPMASAGLMGGLLTLALYRVDATITSELLKLLLLSGGGLIVYLVSMTMVGKSTLRAVASMLPARLRRA